jgi:hypothetical protein
LSEQTLELKVDVGLLLLLMLLLLLLPLLLPLLLLLDPGTVLSDVVEL